MKYIRLDDLQSYCDNQKDHSITPNEFQRMNHYELGWRTGTPQEEGWYIVVENNDENTYEEMFWNGTVFDYYGTSFRHYEVKAWMKIPPYKEENNETDFVD